MDRFLCQLCNSTVLYGEKHPCFCYKNDDDDDHYTQSQLQVSEGKGKKHVHILEESHNRNFTDGSGKIPGNKIESHSSFTSSTAKTNERTFTPALRRISQCPSPIAGISDATSSKTFHDSSSFNSTARIQECEVNLNENNAISEATWNSNALPNTVCSPLKKELEEFNFSGNIHFSTPVAVGCLNNNGKQSNEFMKDAALVAGPSGMHSQSPTNALKRKHACDLCPLQFDYEKQLIVHYRSHTGEKPHKCDFCGKGFTQKGNLVVHCRSHTGEKLYSCNICGKEFTSKAALTYHKGTHTRKAF